VGVLVQETYTRGGEKAIAFRQARNHRAAVVGCWWFEGYISTSDQTLVQGVSR